MKCLRKDCGIGLFSAVQSEIREHIHRFELSSPKIEHRLNHRGRRFARDEMSGDGNDASFVALREVARVTRRDV